MSREDWQKVSEIEEHVWLVEGPSGRAVLKRRNGSSAKRRKRFAAEARETLRLNWHNGVIRVREVDDRPEPAWYVCELGTPLDQHLGLEPHLWDVVSLVADVASTLADLHDGGIFHRDVKPGNLLFARGRAIVADFGIARWPDAALLTAPNEKVGPAYFLAPEMRNNVSEARLGPADVYSLAKTLYVLAVPERGQYPPGGTHYLDASEFSLYRAGQRASRGIEALLEVATSDRPSSRLTMRDFERECRDWLTVTDRDAASRPSSPVFRRGIGPELFAELALVERRRRDLDAKLSAAGAVLAASLGVSNAALGWTASQAHVLGRAYDAPWPPDEGPDAFSCFRSQYQSGRRSVIAGGTFGSTVTYFGEVQGRRSGGVIPVLSQIEPIDAELELPSGLARLREMVETMAAVLRS